MKTIKVYNLATIKTLKKKILYQKNAEKNAEKLFEGKRIWDDSNINKRNVKQYGQDILPSNVDVLKNFHGLEKMSNAYNWLVLTN